MALAATITMAATTPCSLQAASFFSLRSSHRNAAMAHMSLHHRFFSSSSSSPRAISKLKRSLFGTSVKGLKQKPARALPEGRDGVSCLLQEGIVEEELAEAVEAESIPSSTIWMSDVVVKRKRNYFKNREWTAKDLTYAGFMTFMHGLCLFAPATFSWNAVGVFLGLYVVTGMLGITLSFHRNLSHKSFKLPKWLEYTFAYCGVQALQVFSTGP